MKVLFPFALCLILYGCPGGSPHRFSDTSKMNDTDELADLQEPLDTEYDLPMQEDSFPDELDEIEERDILLDTIFMDKDADEEDTAVEVLDPGSSGEYSVAELTFVYELLNVDVRVFYPAETSGLFPVVIFSVDRPLFSDEVNPAAGLYAEYGTRLASHGIVTVMPEWNQYMRPLGENDWALVHINAIAYFIQEYAEEGREHFELFDMSRIGLAGHGVGGKVSVHSAAALMENVQCVFAIDPIDRSGGIIGYDSVSPELTGALTVPSAYMGGDRSSCIPLDESYLSFYASSPSPSYQYTVLGAGRLDFLNECEGFCDLCGSTGVQAGKLAMTTMLSFFKVCLLGEEEYEYWLLDGVPSALCVVEHK